MVEQVIATAIGYEVMEVGEQADALWGLHDLHPVERSAFQVERTDEGVFVGRQFFFAHRGDRYVDCLRRVGDLYGVVTVVLEMHTQL